MSKNQTSQRITMAEIQSVYSTDENIPGQIPFVSFDEKDLTKFKNDLANRDVDAEKSPEDAESYLKSVIIEARDQPDVVVADRSALPKAKKSKPESDLSFKQLSTSSYISISNFGTNYQIDSKYFPTSEWVKDRLAVFEYARQQIANHGGKLRSIRRESKKRPKLPIYPLPEPTDFNAWQKIIFGNQIEPLSDFENGNDEPQSLISANEEKSEQALAEDRTISLDDIETGLPPLMRIILRLTTHQLTALFDLLSMVIDKNKNLNSKCAEWLFSLLAAQCKSRFENVFLIKYSVKNINLAKPIEPSTASRIRNVCRSCRKRRFEMINSGSIDDNELKSLNLFILIISEYFNQKDLADSR